MIKKDLNTKQVGNLFGVDESTIRRWATAGKIKCISSAGGHRKFSYTDIVIFAKENGISINTTSKNIVIDPKKVIKEIVTYSLKQDYMSVETSLIQLYLNGVQLNSLMDDYIEPVLVKIQTQLDNNKISVAEEHIARKIISKGLSQFKLSVINTKQGNGKNVLCLNLENDIPDLPIDMIQILLEDIGYNVHNCGSHTSIEDIKSLLSKKSYDSIFIYMCDRQCCTSTVIDHIEKTNMDLEKISKLAKKYNIRLFLGGPSFEHVNAEVLKHYTRFTKYSDSLLINKS
jgi:methanogenic corrinoid protein MtbC1